MEGLFKTLEGHNPPTENHSARAIPTHVGKIGADFYMNPGAMFQSVKSIWKLEKKNVMSPCAAKSQTPNQGSGSPSSSAMVCGEHRDSPTEA